MKRLGQTKCLANDLFFAPEIILYGITFFGKSAYFHHKPQTVIQPQCVIFPYSILWFPDNFRPLAGILPTGLSRCSTLHLRQADNQCCSAIAQNQLGLHDRFRIKSLKGLQKIHHSYSLKPNNS